MQIRKLYLRHFRCYQEKQLEFGPGLNIICGPNALGKTTILEAIHYLMCGRSFRTSHFNDLIKTGSQGFYLESHFEKFDVPQSLKASFNGKERSYVCNSRHTTSTMDLLGILQGVILTPDDIAIVKGGPTHRRQFLDMQIAQVDPLYVHHLTRYQRALRQRNVLLRTNTLKTIDSWEYELAHSAAYIVQQRRKALVDLEAKTALHYSTICNHKIQISLDYQANAPEKLQGDQLRDFFIKDWSQARPREQRLGFTLNGPHKDDFTIKIDSRDARYLASEGEQRSCVVALKLAEWERMKELVELDPLLMIDDLGLSLDELRQTRLLEHVKSFGQIFITTTHSKFAEGAQDLGPPFKINLFQ